MRILLVGASGTIGKAVAGELGARHDVITAGRSSGDVRLDIADAASVREAYDEVGPVDAVVSACGHVKFAPFAEMTADGFGEGLASKLMGQVNLVIEGRDVVRDGGSFTLTSGILDRDPIVAGTSASMVNGALNAFAMAAAIELPRGLRINVVSPGLLEASAEAYGSLFPGADLVSSERVARAYVKSVEGRHTGRVLEVS